MEKHSEDVDALAKELEQSTKLEEHMQSITSFAEAASAGLQQTTEAKIDHKREVIRRLGIRVELGSDDKNRYADALFIASDLSQMRDTLRIARTLALGIIHPA